MRTAITGALPMLHHLLVLILLSAPLCALDLVAANKTYHQAGRTVVDQIHAKSVTAEAVEAQVLIMVTQAVAMADAYAIKHPAGKELLTVITSKAAIRNADGSVSGLGPMSALSFAELQEKWHDLGHFRANPIPGFDLDDEANEHFTDPIHAIVHPLMVLSAARAYAKDRDAAHLQEMKEEMEEGIEQSEKTADHLK